MQAKKIVYIGTAGSYFTKKFLNTLISSDARSLVFVCVDQPVYHLPVDKADRILKFVFALKNKVEGCRSCLYKNYWRIICLLRGCKVIFLKSIHDDILFNILRQSDFVLTAGISQKFSSKHIQAARESMINFHYAPLPFYRGTHSVLWQKKRGDFAFAYCFHKVTEHIDSGNIVLQKGMDIPAQYSISRICDLLTDHASLQIPELVKMKFDGIPQDESKAKYFSLKHFREYLQMHPETGEWQNKIDIYPLLILDNRFLLHFGKAREGHSEKQIYRSGFKVYLTQKGKKIPILRVNYLPAIFYFRSLKRLLGSAN